MSLITSSKPAEKTVEITVLVELFSTFFEKITTAHPEKEVLMKNLGKFKSFLYGNQQSLEKGHDFLAAMSQQYLSYLREQQNQEQLPAQPQQQQQTAGANPAVTSASSYNQNNLNGGTDNSPNYTQTPSTFTFQYQQSQPQNGLSNPRSSFSSQQQPNRAIVSPSNNNNNINLNSNNLQSNNKTTRMDVPLNKTTNQQSQPQQTTSQLTSLNEFHNKQCSQALSQFTHIREFFQQQQPQQLSSNNLLACIGYRYLEQIIRQGNSSKMQQLLKQLQSNEIQLAQESSKEQLISRLEIILLGIQNGDATTTTANTTSSLLQAFSNTNAIDQQVLVQLVRGLTIKFILESDPRYVQFLLSSSNELSTDSELLNHLRETNEPVEIAMNIIALALEQQITISTIDLNNQHSLYMGAISNNKTFKFNSLPPTTYTTTDVLKINDKPGERDQYYLLYAAQEAQTYMLYDSNSNSNDAKKPRNSKNLQMNDLPKVNVRILQKGKKTKKKKKKEMKEKEGGLLCFN